MMKSVILLCLCSALIVAGASKLGRGGNDKHREARQVPNPADMMGGGGMPGGGPPGGNPGNLAMQGLGNIPDPTAWIAKGQEIASQFSRGRREIPIPKKPTPL